jgi:hypothetical protein
MTYIERLLPCEEVAQKLHGLVKAEHMVKSIRCVPPRVLVWLVRFRAFPRIENEWSIEEDYTIVKSAACLAHVAQQSVRLTKVAVCATLPDYRSNL